MEVEGEVRISPARPPVERGRQEHEMTTYVVKLTATAYGLPVSKWYEVEAETRKEAATAARARAKAAGQTALAFYGEAVTAVKEEQ